MKRKLFILIIFLLPAVLCLGFVFLLNNRPGQTPAEIPPSDIRVGSLNVIYLSYNHNPRATAECLLQTAKEEKLDVLLLQEYKSHWDFDTTEFKKIFRKDFPYISIKDECACVSRYPIKRHKRARYADFSGKYSDLSLDLTSEQDLRIFAVHMITTGVNAERVSFTTLRGNAEIRENQAESLKRSVEAVSSALLVAGDFNSVAGSKVYRKLLRAGLSDSFFKAGHGKGSTYREGVDFLRIDYIFNNEALNCVDSRVVDKGISDHKMIVSSFNFVKQE